MNNLFPEKLSELNRRKIHDDVAAIRLEEEATQGQSKWVDKSLSALGNWMVVRGEKLRKRRAESMRSSVDLLQDRGR